MRFSDILGLNDTKDQLIKSVDNNRIAHSHLFLGDRGSAKLAVALAFAQYINCKEKSDKDSCGKCDSCIKYEKLAHPDLHLIFPVLQIKNIKKAISDNFIIEFRNEILKNPYLSIYHWFSNFSEENKTGKTGYIYTQEIESLQKKLALKNYESEYRVVLIWMPEKMQINTSNKILKVLEEPPRKTIFLLVSENEEALLKTIVSRVQKTVVSQYDDLQIKEYLNRASNEHSPTKIEETIKFSDKDLGEAIYLLGDPNFEEKNFEYFQSWMRTCYSSNIKEITLWSQEISKEGRLGQSQFLKYCLKMIRNCLSYHFFEDRFLIATKKEIKFLIKFHVFINENNIIEVAERLEEAIRNIERNGNSKIIFYELSLQLIRILKVNRKFVA